MKKFGILFLALLSVVTLSACNSSGERTNSKTPLNSNSDFTTSTSTAEAQTYEGQLLYQDDYIQVTNTNGLISFKNISSKGIYVDGHGYIDDSYLVANMTFGYVGTIKAGTSQSKDINNLTLVNQAKDGDELDVEKANGEKLYRHAMKSGEKVTWTGIIRDGSMDGDELKAISFSFVY